MRGLYSSAALAVLIGCAGPQADPSTDPSGGSGDDGDPTVGQPPPPPPACPLGGVAAYTRALGLATATTALDVAITTDGDAVFAAAGGEATGVTFLSPSGAILYGFPVGSLVATDRAGNTYIAGSFTQPIDLGLGVIKPDGIDTFVAKIDAAGNVVFARALGLCGDDVTSLGVGADGRVAISGTAMGTAVLSANGDVAFSLAFSGDVAFDSKGDLVVAGSFHTIDLGDGVITAQGTGDDGFVILVDRSGARLWSHVLSASGSQGRVTSVAVDANDNIVFVGFTDGSIDLLGLTIRVHFASEVGRVDGSFLVKLDAAGDLVFATPSRLGSEANGVAVDAFGTIYVNGASTGANSFGRIVHLNVFTAAGTARQEFYEFVSSGYGRGLGVATDACGAVYATFDAADTATPGSPIRAFLVKLSP